jgi:guanylate kinase
MSNDGPLFFIVSSPSGAGKTTLTTRLREQVPNLSFSVSHTTRAPRAGERDGREYHFVTRGAFESSIANDEFLEWAEVHGNLYGTARAEITRAAGARGVIFDIDHQGARQIKSREPDAMAVFILPPDMVTLLERQRRRASDDEATIQRRFAGARAEIAHYWMFDYMLVNDDLEEATAKLVSIFRAGECRRRRMARFAERLLAEGRGMGTHKP